MCMDGYSEGETMEPEKLDRDPNLTQSATQRGVPLRHNLGYEINKAI